MPSRDEILDELGLGPVWKLRLVRNPNVAAGAAEMPHRAAPQMGEPGSREARIAVLEWRDFAADVDACTACGLYRGRKKSVPGVGDPNADWLFVGEGPGAEEDAKGEPFVGQAGKLLDNMLAAIRLRRGNNVYIANIVKCRPPGNRNPELAEVSQCEPYLWRQIDLIKPKLIVALGKTAAVNLLKRDAPVASMRGKVHEYQGVPLIVTYHPAYLLREPDRKRLAWHDLLMLKAALAAETTSQKPETGI